MKNSLKNQIRYFKGGILSLIFLLINKAKDSRKIINCLSAQMQNDTSMLYSEWAFRKFIYFAVIIYQS
jgi:hypothetical protein